MAKDKLRITLLYLQPTPTILKAPPTLPLPVPPLAFSHSITLHPLLKVFTLEVLHQLPSTPNHFRYTWGTSFQQAWCQTLLQSCNHPSINIPSQILSNLYRPKLEKSSSRTYPTPSPRRSFRHYSNVQYISPNLAQSTPSNQLKFPDTQMVKPEAMHLQPSSLLTLHNVP